MAAMEPVPELLFAPPLSDGLSAHAPTSLMSLQGDPSSGLYFYRKADSVILSRFLWRYAGPIDATKGELCVDGACTTSSRILNRKPVKAKLSELPNGYQLWIHYFTPKSGINQKIALDTFNEKRLRDGDITAETDDTEENEMGKAVEEALRLGSKIVSVSYKGRM
ncbi:hypothetical protein HDU93_003821 [Gonapodya sp. JEL0774]|nr:hypothetical protein HDU93_003821 [Gonapodya sp. JEL0774]